MSFILEALQRADQERKRTQEIATPSVVGATIHHHPTSAWSRSVGWSVALLLLALLVWSQLAPMLSSPNIPPPPKVVLSPKAAAPIQPTPAPPPKSIATVATAKKVTQPPVVSVPEPSAPIPLEALPFLIRKQLPEIHLSALIDHQDPARRVAWINDRSRHIGAWLTESVRLIAISEHSVTLEFQGYRIVVTPF